MSVLARLGLALVFLGLGVIALLYAAAVAPGAWRGEDKPAVFAWTAADSACLEAYEDCDGEALVAMAPSGPLSARPFALQLVEEIVSGNAQGAADMAAQVLARDPRSRDARQVLAAEALRQEDYDAFLTLFLPLFDVDAPQRAAYADVLAQLSTRPEIRAALGPRLEEQAPWAGAYLAALARRGGLPVSDLIMLYRHVPGAQTQLLRRLTQAGQWDLAYIAFADFVSAAPGEAALALSVPFNPGLAENAGPAPFNWAPASRSAQLQEEGGLYAFYEGRRPETLLVQSFPLSPGAWELVVEQSGEATESGGFFRWQITCASGGAPLFRFDVRSLKAATESQAWEFDLAPGSCPYLTLSLSGVPGSFPRPGRIEVKSARLLQRAAEGAAP